MLQLNYDMFVSFICEKVGRKLPAFVRLSNFMNSQTTENLDEILK